MSNRNCWELQYTWLYKYFVLNWTRFNGVNAGNYILAIESDRRCRTINPRMTSPPNCARWYVVVRRTIFDNSQHVGQLLRKRDHLTAVVFSDNLLSASRRVSTAELLNISEKFVRLKWSAHIDKFVQNTSRLKRFAWECEGGKSFSWKSQMFQIFFQSKISLNE